MKKSLGYALFPESTKLRRSTFLKPNLEGTPMKRTINLKPRSLNGISALGTTEEGVVEGEGNSIVVDTATEQGNTDVNPVLEEAVEDTVVKNSGEVEQTGFMEVISSLWSNLGLDVSIDDFVNQMFQEELNKLSNNRDIVASNASNFFVNRFMGNDSLFYRVVLSTDDKLLPSVGYLYNVKVDMGVNIEAQNFIDTTLNSSFKTVPQVLNSIELGDIIQEHGLDDDFVVYFNTLALYNDTSAKTDVSGSNFLINALAESIAVSIGANSLGLGSSLNELSSSDLVSCYQIGTSFTHTILNQASVNNELKEVVSDICMKAISSLQSMLNVAPNTLALFADNANGEPIELINFGLPESELISFAERSNLKAVNAAALLYNGKELSPESKELNTALIITGVESFNPTYAEDTETLLASAVAARLNAVGLNLINNTLQLLRDSLSDFEKLLADANLEISEVRESASALESAISDIVNLDNTINDSIDASISLTLDPMGLYYEAVSLNSEAANNVDVFSSIVGELYGSEYASEIVKLFLTPDAETEENLSIVDLITYHSDSGVNNVLDVLEKDVTSLEDQVAKNDTLVSNLKVALDEGVEKVAPELIEQAKVKAEDVNKATLELTNQVKERVKATRERLKDANGKARKASSENKKESKGMSTGAKVGLGLLGAGLIWAAVSHMNKKSNSELN